MVNCIVNKWFVVNFFRPNPNSDVPTLRLIDFGCAIDMKFFEPNTQFKKVIKILVVFKLFYEVYLLITLEQFVE